MIARITAEAAWSGSTERSDGSALQMATVPLPDGNVLLTCLDVTDTARVERALRERNEALETAARLKSEFIANVSYELRTPLNAIIGFAEILANQYFGPLTPRQLEYSRGILDSSQRLMQLINDILDLATIEAGYLALETGSVEICDMLEAVAVLSRERARMQDVTLTVSCPRDIGAIEADERRLKQALFNLVSNAIKFTPPGGSIRLEARIDEDAGRRCDPGGRRYRGRHRRLGSGAGFREIRARQPAQPRVRRRARPVAGQEPDRAARRLGRDPIRGGRRNNRPVPPAGQPAPAGRQGRRAGAAGLAAFARGSIRSSAMPGFRRQLIAPASYWAATGIARWL